MPYVSQDTCPDFRKTIRLCIRCANLFTTSSSKERLKNGLCFHDKVSDLHDECSLCLVIMQALAEALRVDHLPPRFDNHVISLFLLETADTDPISSAPNSKLEVSVLCSLKGSPHQVIAKLAGCPLPSKCH